MILALTVLEPVCCKKQPKIVPDQLLKDLKDFKLILNESKLSPLSSRISFVRFRTFRGSLFPKTVTGQELFLAVSYSKPDLVGFSELNTLRMLSGVKVVPA